MLEKHCSRIEPNNFSQRISFWLRIQSNSKEHCWNVSKSNRIFEDLTMSATSLIGSDWIKIALSNSTFSQQHPPPSPFLIECLENKKKWTKKEFLSEKRNKTYKWRNMWKKEINVVNIKKPKREWRRFSSKMTKYKKKTKKMSYTNQRLSELFEKKIEILL